MITCIFDHFTLNLRFTTVMLNTLRRGREILNPRPTLIKGLFFLPLSERKYYFYLISGHEAPTPIADEARRL